MTSTQTGTWTPPTPGERQPDPRIARPHASGSSRAGHEFGGGLDRGDVETPPPSRSLWVIFGSLLVVAGLLSGTSSVVSLLAHDERVTTETFAAADLGITAIDVGSAYGTVEIVGSAGEDIVVVAEISRGIRDTGVRSGVVGATLELANTCPNFGSEWCWVNYTIEVPRDLDVVVDADDRVTVRNVDGDVHIDVDNGRATLLSIGGAISVDADNGRVEGSNLSGPTADVSADNGRVELMFSEPPDLVVAESDNGSIDVAVPPVDGAYRVEADTDNGSQNIDIANDPESSRVIRVRSSNGSVTVRPTD